MKKKKSKLQLAQDEAQAAINNTNKKIEELGAHSEELCAVLNRIQELFDDIRNMPSDKKLEFEKLRKIRLNWIQQAEKIERDYKAAAVKEAGAGAAGIGVGVTVVALGADRSHGNSNDFWSSFNRNGDFCIKWCSSNKCCISLAWRRCTCRWWRRYGCR